MLTSSYLFYLSYGSVLSVSYKLSKLINSSLDSIPRSSKSNRDEGILLYDRPRNDIQKDLPSLALIRALCSPMINNSKDCFKQEGNYKSLDKLKISVEQLLKFDQLNVKIRGDIVKIYDCLLRENNTKDEATKIGCGLS